MGVFERMSNYSARGKEIKSDVFDTTTPAGAFLSRIHNEGYKMYIRKYKLPDKITEGIATSSLTPYIKEKYKGLNLIQPCVVTEDEISGCDKSFLDLCETSVEFTEAYNVITTSGNQLVNAIAGSGKALVNSSLVLTDKGYEPIGSLKVGDHVIGTDGAVHNVIGVYPQGKKQVYDVTFSDGNVIHCSGDHIWTLSEHRVSTKPRKCTDYRTEDLVDVHQLSELRRKPTSRLIYNHYLYYLPSIEPVRFNEDAKVPVQSYLLGVLLGCGTMTDEAFGVYFSSDKLKDYVTKLLNVKYPAIQLVHKDGCYYELISSDGVNPLKVKLNDLGLWGISTDNYFIPEVYFKASVKSRYNLLCGLHDARPSDTKTISYDFTFVSEQLIRGIETVAEQLGCIAIRPAKCIRPTVRVMFNSISNGFTKFGNVQNVRNSNNRRLVSVERTNEFAEMTCIEVDSPDHLYLTEHCIPTHNTTTLIFKIMYDLVTGTSKKMVTIPSGESFAVPDSIFVGTFLRTGAEELQDKLGYWQRRLGYATTQGQIQFSTLDAEFKRCLNAMNIPTPIGDEKVLSGLRKKAIDSCGITRNGNPLNAEDYQIISSIITYYRGRLDDKKYQHPSARDYGLTPSILDLVVKQYASLRQVEGVLDFEEIQELLYQYLYVTPNKAVQDFVANRFKFMYVDEFQDTSQMQYALLKYYARGHQKQNILGNKTEDISYTGVETRGKFVVVGDPSQCFHPKTKLLKGMPLLTLMTDACQLKKGDTMITPTGVEHIESTILKYSNSTKMIRFVTRYGDLTVTPEHKLFSRAEHIVKFDAVVYFADKDRHLYTDEYGYEHWFENTSDIEAYLGGGMNTADIYYKFGDTYYECISAEDIGVGTRLAYWVDDNYFCDSVLGIEKFDYIGFVCDMNVPSHVLFTESGLVAHNCIYSFKGSDKEIICEKFDEDFMPTHTALSYNYRCPSNILEPVVSSISLNPEGAKQSINAFKSGGIYHPYKFSSMQNMVQKLKEDVNEDLSNNMSVAILCRTNFDGLIPAFVLESEKVFDFSISGANMTMNSPLPRKLVGMASLFTERATPMVRTALEQVVARYDYYGVKQLVDTMKNNNLSIWQIPEPDIDHSVPSLLPFITQLKGVCGFNGVTRDKTKDMDGLRFMYCWLLVNTYGGSSAYCLSARSYIECLLYIIETHDFKTVHEFLAEIDDIDERLSGRIGRRNAPVAIATVHEYKGKERDSVYVWNDSDSVFPSNKCDLNEVEQVEEERRVHYIACTRAKKKCSVYTLANRMGMFAKELKTNFTNPVNPQKTLKK